MIRLMFAIALSVCLTASLFAAGINAAAINDAALPAKPVVIDAPGGSVSKTRAPMNVRTNKARTTRNQLDRSQQTVEGPTLLRARDRSCCFSAKQTT